MSSKFGRKYGNNSDPLTRLLAPSPKESPQERDEREQAEAHARNISAEIDRMLSQDKERVSRKSTVNLLLLGQSESGKSTTLKNFQLLYTPNFLHEQRAAWRLVILLNLIRSVHLIHDVVSEALQAQKNSPVPSSPLYSNSGLPDFSLPPAQRASFQNSPIASAFEFTHQSPTRETFAKAEDVDMTDVDQSEMQSSKSTLSLNNKTGENKLGKVFNFGGKKISRSKLKRPVTSPGHKSGIQSVPITADPESRRLAPGSGEYFIERNRPREPPIGVRIRPPSKPTPKPPVQDLPQLTDQHELLVMRLTPLLALEQQLRRKLAPATENEGPNLAHNSSFRFSNPLQSTNSSPVRLQPPTPMDWTSVPTSYDSTETEALILSPIPMPSSPQNSWKQRISILTKAPSRQNTAAVSDPYNPWNDPDDPAHLLQACSQDIQALWKDPIVRRHLSHNGLNLEHSPGFFLDDIERIVARDYLPLNDDILRARVKTIGASEYRFDIPNSTTGLKQWLVYDVGGTRTQRSAWQPFFDDANAIIFIVATSAFDQPIAEDLELNRMEDSMRAFRDVIRSPILKRVNIILFLNKIDLLEAKLKSGIQVAKYCKAFGSRPNNVEHVIKFFRDKFEAIYRHYSPQDSSRVFRTYQTSLTDPNSTKSILIAVQETILEGNLANSFL